MNCNSVSHYELPVILKTFFFKYYWVKIHVPKFNSVYVCTFLVCVGKMKCTLPV